MGRAYKNFWSLNTDEAVVTGILRGAVDKKKIEVLMPLNAQMKGIDLFLMNIKTKKSLSIQVKGSKAFEPTEKEVERFTHGSGGWFFLAADVIHRATADYFIFLIYVIVQLPEKGRRYFEPHTITLPTAKLQALAKKYKKLHPNNYSFYFWVNPKEKKAFDHKDTLYDVSEYLDKKGFKKMNKELE